MPILGKLRAGIKMTAAVQLVNKELEVTDGLAANSKELAEEFVLGIWKQTPALTLIQQIPDSAALAAAALAYGVEYVSPSPAQSRMRQLVEGALRRYIAHTMPKLIHDPTNLRGVDSDLVDYAYRIVGT